MKTFGYSLAIVALVAGFLIGTNHRDQELRNKIKSIEEFSNTSSAPMLILLKEITSEELDTFLEHLDQQVLLLESNISTENIKAARLALENLNDIRNGNLSNLEERQISALKDFYLKHKNSTIRERRTHDIINNLISSIESDPALMKYMKAPSMTESATSQEHQSNK